jgi:hypothetical protein
MRSFADILVYERVFEPDNFTKIEQLIKTPSWRMQTSMEKGGSTFWKLVLDDNKFITETCFNQIKELIGDNFTINTVYINAQSSLQSGDPHIDSEVEDEYTFMIYINQDWDITWGGHTVFFSRYWDNLDKTYNNFFTHTDRIHTVSFLPVPNLGLFFPSNIVHFAEGPSKKMSQLRLTLAYKLKKII